MRKPRRTALDYLCERWQNSRKFLIELRNRLATFQPGAHEYVALARRIKNLEIDTGLWEGRAKGEKDHTPCT